jgi:AcrR family transcriptional regulator
MRKRGTEIRREQLAQAALSLVAARGLKGLSVARVARKVGLVPSAIYRHFPGRDGLLDAMIALIRERLNGNVARVLEQSPDADERLRLLLLAHVGMIRENKGILRIAFSDDLHMGNARRKAAVHDMVAGYLIKVAAIVSQGQQEGRFREDLDPAAVSVMFLGLIQPAAILWSLSRGRFDVVRQVERAWPVFVAAISKA